MVGDITINEFLDLLGQSDLVSDAQLLALNAEFLGEGKPAENPQVIADELVKREVLTPWQAEMLLQGKHRGFRLGPYRILRPLGQGGMSKVFLAEHEMMRRRSAIKVLPSKYQEDADLLRRFHLEARAVAALDHPNIVRAYDFNKDVRYGKEIHYLVMEYVEGADLRRLVEEEGPLDFRKAADFICQAAQGLAHAHTAGFVHRDIKPANLLVDPHGVLKILDLGLATFTFETEQTFNPAESAQSAVGTADYVSPEQVIDSRNVDGRTDIYSLGLTFYYLLTGRRPYAKPTIMEVLMAHRTERYEAITKIRPDVPLDLESIIDKMTAKTPQQRYQKASEVVEVLQKWLKDAGSARSYSRLSALMAEASRVKPPSTTETLPVASSMATTELELKLADDPSVAGSGKKPDAGVAHDAGELTVAESLEGKGASAKSGKLPKAKPIEGGVAPVKPVQAKPLETPPPAKHVSTHTDLLAGLLDEELAAETPLEGVMLAPLGSARRGVGWSGIVYSPWFWLGAGACLIFATIVIAVSETSPSTPEPKPPATTTPKGDMKPGDSVVPTPSTPSVVEKKHTTAAPVVIVPPKTQPSTETKPKPPVQPATPKQEPKPAATEAMKEQPKPVLPPGVAELAGLKTIAVRLGNSIEANPSSSLNQAVLTKAKGAARRLDIEPDDNSPNVLEVSMTENQAHGKLTIVFAAQLNCPGQNGKSITVWRKSEPMFSGDLQKVSRKLMMQTLRQGGAKEFAEKFFEFFSADVVKAREQSGAK